MTGRVDAELWRRFTSAVSHGGARFLMVAPRARNAILGERIRAAYGMEATISCSSGPASWHPVDACWMTTNTTTVL